MGNDSTRMYQCNNDLGNDEVAVEQCSLTIATVQTYKGFFNRLSVPVILGLVETDTNSSHQC